MSQLSPLRPVLGNGDPLIEILRNALTFERVLQRPAPSHLWTTNRPRMRYPTHTLMPTLPPYLRLPLLQQHARSGFSFYRGREEAVHYDRLRRLILECSYGRESIEAV